MELPDRREAFKWLGSVAAVGLVQYLIIIAAGGAVTALASFVNGMPTPWRVVFLASVFTLTACVAWVLVQLWVSDRLRPAESPPPPPTAAQTPSPATAPASATHPSEQSSRRSRRKTLQLLLGEVQVVKQEFFDALRATEYTSRFEYPADRWEAVEETLAEEPGLEGTYGKLRTCYRLAARADRAADATLDSRITMTLTGEERKMFVAAAQAAQEAETELTGQLERLAIHARMER